MGKLVLKGFKAKMEKKKEGGSNSMAQDASSPAVGSGAGSNSNLSAPTLDKKAFADQFEQRMQAKIEKEKEGGNNSMTQDAPSPAKTHVMCAAGHHCMADPEIAIDLTNSPHECMNCCEKMHDPSTCGEMFVDVEDIHGFAIPTHMLSENGQLKLREQVSASNLAICCVCIDEFRLPCLLTGTAAEASTQVAKGGLEANIYQNSMMRKLNGKLESVEGDDDEDPRPSAYASAQYDEMDAAVKRAVKNTPQMNPPVPPATEAKMAAMVEDTEIEIKKKVNQAVNNTPQMSPPVPPAAEAKMAAMVEDTDMEIKKKAFISPGGAGGNVSETPILTPGAPQEQSAVPSAQAQQTAPIITRPPPRSMLPSNQQSTPSLPVIQATLVEEEPPAPVYDAIPFRLSDLQPNDLQPSDIQSLPWWKRRVTLGMGCIIVVLAATVGTLIGFRGSNNDSESATAGGTDTEGGSDTKNNDSKEITALDVFQPSQYPSQQGTTPPFSPSESAPSGSGTDTEGGRDTSDDSNSKEEVTAFDVFQPSQYPSQQSTAPSFSSSCNSHLAAAPVCIADTISGKGIVFAIQSDVDDEAGLEITSLGFHVNSGDLPRGIGNNNKQAEGGFIEYEVYTLSDGAGSPDGYYADPNRAEDFNNVLADTTSYDFRGQMDQWDLIAAGNITSDNLTKSFTTMDTFEPDYFQIPYEGFTKTSVPGNGKVRSFYIATPRSASILYADPPYGKLVNSETPLSELSSGSVMEGEYTPKILTGEGVATYPMDLSAYMYQTKSFVGKVYWERDCSSTSSPSRHPSTKHTPTTSVAPSDLPPIGILACQCNNQGMCLENVVQHYRSRNVRICLQSTPPQSEIVRIEALYFELTDGTQSAALKTQSVISSDQPVTTPGLPSDMFVPPGLDGKADKRFRTIQTVLKGIFFDFDTTSMHLKAKGVVLVRDNSNVDGPLRRLQGESAIMFELDLIIVDEPSSLPSSSPTPRDVSYVEPKDSSLVPSQVDNPTLISSYHNDFEKGVLFDYPDWSSSGDGDWFVTYVGTHASSGAFSLRSPLLTSTGSANVTFATNPDWGAGVLKFSILSSVWIPLDKLNFYIDGAQQGEYLEQTAFQKETFQLGPGQHSIVFEYRYNPNNFPPGALPPYGMFLQRLGAVFIDDVSFSEYVEPTDHPLTGPSKKPSAGTPTPSPTTSIAPSKLPPIGILACQCNNQGECLENVVQHYSSRNVRICLQSTPPQSEIVQIAAMYFALTDGVQSAPLETQSVISNDQPVTTQGLLSKMFVPPGYKRFRTIQTVLKGKFFDFDTISMHLKASGFALVRDNSSVDGPLRRLQGGSAISFELDLIIVDEPSSLPSSSPTTIS